MCPQYNGQGGLGGPGGFRGGDGAYQLVNFATRGGNGLGPGGGNGTADAAYGYPYYGGGGGTFVGVPELLPLIGGCGGGGGASIDDAVGSSGGGGGGGGGAILIAANGTISVNGTITAIGGNGGRYGSSAYTSSSGGGGSGGAIRLVADTITGTGILYAYGGSGAYNAAAGGRGAIRLEAFTNTMSPTNTSPPAYRAPAPGPLVNPLMPTVAITAVGGEMVTPPPQGVFGDVDVIVPAQGPTTIELETSGVPIGTLLELTIKPRVGAAPSVESVELDPSDCNEAGDCAPSVTVHLMAGAHTIEARATFQIP